MKNVGLRSGGWDVSSDDVQVWVEKLSENSVGLTLYCEKLLPLLREEKNRAWWLLSTLTDQVLGEVASIALIRGFDVVDTPKEGTSILLPELPEAVEGMGLPAGNDAEAYLENSYLAYQLEPVEDPNADWRLDVYAGSTRLPAPINEYLEAQSGTIDDYHADGAAAGFLCYPLDGFTGEGRGKAALDFRDSLEADILQNAGADAVTFLGGASGICRGYLDFIAWDLPAVLHAAGDFFTDSGLPWANFHVFRRDAATVRLLNREKQRQ